MTEDEAFIRTIVDRPGDDLPRLVYADWLDERNDPRGVYLRAEAEWAKAKQTAGFIVLRLNGLAEGLDPVWVARVSRPPVGVCFDFHMQATSQRPIAHCDLDQASDQLEKVLPPQLRALILNLKSGYLSNPLRLRYAPQRRERRIGCIVNLCDASEFNPIGTDLVRSTYNLWQEEDFPDHLLFLAQGEDEDVYLVSAGPSDAGQVYACWHSSPHQEPAEENLALIADSISGFLVLLEPSSSHTQ